MKRFGLIGYPIKGSLSPVLFSAGYHGKYVYDLIENPDFETSYQIFADSYAGINVTAPYKENALRMAGHIDPVCRKIGAANLLVKTQDGIHAYNSDYTGIRRSLLEAMTGWKYGENEDEAAETVHGQGGRRISALVVGCGGAGKAAAVASADLGMHVFLMNRTLNRAEQIAANLPQYGFQVKPLAEFTQMFRQCDVIIYTLPDSIESIGSLGDGHTMETSEHIAANRPKVILEANYKTPAFNQSTIAQLSSVYRDVRYISGLRWLLHQAAGGYELFTGEIPDFQAMEQAVVSR